MPGDFLDTSALARHYHPEQGSAEIDKLWSDPNQALFVSRLSALEIVLVFAGKVRAGAISTADFDALRRAQAVGARFLTRNTVTPSLALDITVQRQFFCLTLATALRVDGALLRPTGKYQLRGEPT